MPVLPFLTGSTSELADLSYIFMKKDDQRQLFGYGLYTTALFKLKKKYAEKVSPAHTLIMIPGKKVVLIVNDTYVHNQLYLFGTPINVYSDGILQRSFIGDALTYTGAPNSTAEFVLGRSTVKEIVFSETAEFAGLTANYLLPEYATIFDQYSQVFKPSKPLTYPYAFLIAFESMSRYTPTDTDITLAAKHIAALQGPTSFSTHGELLYGDVLVQRGIDLTISVVANFLGDVLVPTQQPETFAAEFFYPNTEFSFGAITPNTRPGEKELLHAAYEVLPDSLNTYLTYSISEEFYIDTLSHMRDLSLYEMPEYNVTGDVDVSAYYLEGADITAIAVEFTYNGFTISGIYLDSFAKGRVAKGSPFPFVIRNCDIKLGTTSIYTNIDLLIKEATLSLNNTLTIVSSFFLKGNYINSPGMLIEFSNDLYAYDRRDSPFRYTAFAINKVADYLGPIVSDNLEERGKQYPGNELSKTFGKPHEAPITFHLVDLDFAPLGSCTMNLQADFVFDAIYPARSHYDYWRYIRRIALPYNDDAYVAYLKGDQAESFTPTLDGTGEYIHDLAQDPTSESRYNLYKSYFTFMDTFIQEYVSYNDFMTYEMFALFLRYILQPLMLSGGTQVNVPTDFYFVIDNKIDFLGELNA